MVPFPPPVNTSLAADVTTAGSVLFAPATALTYRAAIVLLLISSINSALVVQIGLE